MKKLIFGLIATAFFTSFSFGQDKFIDDQNLIEVNQSQTSIVQIKCKKFSIGLNIGIAWVETDVYVAYGLPVGMGAGGGTVMIVNEDFCKSIGQAKNVSPSMFLNIKNLISDIDISKIDFVEIKNSTTYIDEEDNTKSAIQLGKYAVDKDGNFKIEVITVK